MLTHEQARAELRTLENKQWVAARLTAAEGLPANLRETARSLLGRGDTIGGPMVLDGNVKVEVVKALTEMDEAGRRQFFEAMAPGLGSVIERGWQFFDRLPYQAGYTRKPFRAPGHPESYFHRRINWVLAVIPVVGPYQQNIAWFAAWAPYLAQYRTGDVLGLLLAAGMDAGGSEGEEVFQILCASARNEHPIGGMGRHVTRALLSAERQDGWQFVENMLLAAQREEGLRQIILETVDEAHPQAFRRMLRLILDQDLARFSATVRAFDTWLGYMWDAVSSGVVNKTIEKMLLYLEDQAARETALKGKDAEQTYLALWAQAFDDAVAVVAPAAELLKHPNAEHRFVAVHLLHQLGLVMSQRRSLIALEDSDPRVAARALQGFQNGADPRVIKGNLFESIEKLVSRFPGKPEKLRPAVWPWTELTVSKETAADTLPHCLGERAPTRLIPHLGYMGTHARANVIGLLAVQKTWDASTRDTLFALVGDPSRNVREAALRHLANCELTPLESGLMENLLDRKTGDLRRGVLTVLTRQADEAALASADRLLASKSQPQRLAGLELLRLLVEKKRCETAARARAESYSRAHPKLNETEQQQLSAVLAAEAEAPTLDDALGLLRHDDRTWAPPPVARNVAFHSPAAKLIVSQLTTIFVDRAREVVSFKKPDGDIWKGLLSELTHAFPNPDPKLPAAEDRERLPLADVWEDWWQSRGPELRDADRMELLRATAWFHSTSQRYGRDKMIKQYAEVYKTVFGAAEAEQDKEMRWQVRSVLSWLLRFHPPAGAVAFALDAAESALAFVPKDALYFTPDEVRKLAELEGKMVHHNLQDWQRRHQQTEQILAKTRWRMTDSPFGVWLAV